MKDIVNVIKESIDGEVKNSKLRRLLDKAGYASIHLIKGKGYFYIMSDDTDKEMEDLILGMYDTDIYMNSFGQQSPEEWFADIDRMIKKEKEQNK